jgi:transcription elongation factor Elf1
MGHRQPHVPCVIDGKTFASEAEGRRYQELKLMQRSGVIKRFELQPRFPLMQAFRKCKACGHNQEHIPDTQKKSVILCHKCGKKTKVVQGMEYVADFLVTYPDGREVIEDVKGTKRFMDEVFKHKWKWFDLLYPGKNIEIVVMPVLKKPKATRRR